MKNVACILASLICLAIPTLHAADPMSAAAPRFYGKITAIDHGQKSIVVHNKKQQSDARFVWNDQTKLIDKKKAIEPTQLQVGQSLIVSYVTENDLNKAKKITVTHPFKKKASAE